MPDAIIIQVADAVTAELNTASFSQSFTAVRSYRPYFNIRDLSNLAVVVVPISRLSTLLNRGGAQFNDYVIDIGIEKSLPHGPLTNTQINAACDPLMKLAEEMVSQFYLNQLSGFPGARCTNAKNEPIFAPHHIDEEKVFTSIISLTFRIGI